MRYLTADFEGEFEAAYPDVTIELVCRSLSGRPGSSFSAVEA